eukprot:g32189.t1
MKEVVPPSYGLEFEEYPENIREIIREIQGYIFTRRIRVKDIFLDFDPLRCGRCTPYQFVRGLNSIAPQLTAHQMRILTAVALDVLHGAPVVLLQHGVLASSWCWLVNTPNRSLGISLWKMGYDVWLTNSRGNTFSRNHTELKPFLDKQFWNYTFDDMGYFDVVANVRYILNATSRKDLTFVGWSQGTSQMFVAAQGPDRDYLKSHVNLFVALSPVTYLTHQSSLLLSVAQKFRLGVILEKAFPYDVFSWSELPTLGSLLCKVTLGVICDITVDVICGRSQKDSSDAILNLAAHFPAGTSIKDLGSATERLLCGSGSHFLQDLDHYEQFIDYEHFGRFDYGTMGNLEHYGLELPPEYSLSELEIPTALFCGSKDTLAGPKDVERLKMDLKGNKHVVFSKEYEDYSHLTWMVGLTDEWITDLKALLRQYNPDFYADPVQDMMKPQVVRHLEFIRAVDGVFGGFDLEKQPVVKVPRPGHCLKKNGEDINPCDDEAAVEQTLRRLALMVKTRGVIFANCFQEPIFGDAERSLDTSLLCPRFAGKVTEAQFCSHFPFMQEISEYELGLLLQRYYNSEADGINYMAMDKDLQALVEEPLQESCILGGTRSTCSGRPGSLNWSPTARLQASQEKQTTICGIL